MRDVILKVERDLSNSILNTFTSGVKFSWTSLYSNWFRNRTAPWVARAALSVPLVLAVVVMRQVGVRGVMIPSLDPDPESDFQLF